MNDNDFKDMLKDIDDMSKDEYLAYHNQAKKMSGVFNNDACNILNKRLYYFIRLYKKIKKSYNLIVNYFK